MNRFSSYNKIFFLYKYDMYVHYDNKGEFIFVNTSNIHFNVFDYLTVQYLYNSPNDNVHFFNNHIMKSVFDTNVRKRQEKIYREAQRFKLAFSRFVHMVKLKVKKKHNYVNLVFQPFHKKPICICDNNRVYSFEDLELYHMVESCFNYETYDIPTILHLKNPYTNLPFKLHHLIYIYFELLQRGKNSLFFTLYFKHNFSKDALMARYEVHLYVNCLKHKYHQLSDTRKLHNLHRMFRAFPKYSAFVNIRVELFQKLFGNLSEPFFIYRNLKHIGADDDSAFLNLYEKKIRNRLSFVLRKNPMLGRKILSKSKETNRYVYHVNEDISQIISM